MSEQQVDIAQVVKKLQERLSEAMTTIIVLECQLEQLRAEHTHESEAPVEPSNL